jgi:hypothetical protein
MALLPSLQADLDYVVAELLRQARHDAQGTYWLTPPGLPTTDPAWQLDESIFSGSTGIVLFFGALYQYSGELAHRQVAEDGTRWLIAHAQAQAPQHLSFFSGRLGVVYLCCKTYELTHNTYYLQQAQLLAQAVRASLLAGNGSPDLLGGEAGNLFVITYLYQLTGAAEWLPVLRAGLARLVRGARPSRKGVRWGYQPNALDSLTGLSHGASGIAHVLLELGHYFRSPALHWLADQAMRYEGQYFRRAESNWLDVRVYAEYTVDDAAWQLPQDQLLVGSGNTNSWAYGATGIGLVRLRALALIPLPRYQKEALASLAKTRRDWAQRGETIDFTLTGWGGRAELLLTAAATLGGAPHRILAQQVAQAASQQRQRLGHWLGKGGAAPAGPALLTGMAGIGYLLLRTLSPARGDSVLLPCLPTGALPAGRLGHLYQNPASLWTHLWGQHFERTRWLLGQLSPASLTHLFAEEAGGSLTLQTVQARLYTVIKDLPQPQKRLVAEAFRLEKTSLTLLLRKPAFICQVTQQHRHRQSTQQLATLAPADFLPLVFRRSAQARLLPNCWPWPAHRPAAWRRNLTAPASQHPCVLLLTGDTVAEYAIGAFSAALLWALAKPASVATVLPGLRQQFGLGPGDEVLGRLLSAITAQLQQLSEVGFIEQVHCYPYSQQCQTPDAQSRS